MSVFLTVLTFPMLPFVWWFRGVEEKKYRNHRRILSILTVAILAIAFGLVFTQPSNPTGVYPIPVTSSPVASTKSPTNEPTFSPGTSTSAPTTAAPSAPTVAPTSATNAPTKSPTTSPTAAPTASPTKSPTVPTAAP